MQKEITNEIIAQELGRTLQAMLGSQQYAPLVEAGARVTITRDLVIGWKWRVTVATPGFKESAEKAVCHTHKTLGLYADAHARRRSCELDAADMLATLACQLGRLEEVIC